MDPFQHPPSWLLKTEPDEFSLLDLQALGDTGTSWTGVRNYQAMNYFKAMRLNDYVFIYETGHVKSIVGLGRISREYYPDPTDINWLTVDIVYVAHCGPFSLKHLKEKALHNTLIQFQPLLRQPRLSIMPMDKMFIDYITKNF